MMVERAEGRVVVIAAVPTREVISAPAVGGGNEVWEEEVEIKIEGGDDGKGKNEEWERAVPYIAGGAE